MKALGVEFGIYVPSAKWASPMTAGFTMGLLDAAGGYTAIPAFGAYLMPNGAVANEPVTIVRARAEKFDYAAQTKLDRAFKELANLLIASGEKAVLMERNGEAWLQEGINQTPPTASHRPATGPAVVG
jgi:hypothetical protein